MNITFNTLKLSAKRVFKTTSLSNIHVYPSHFICDRSTKDLNHEIIANRRKTFSERVQQTYLMAEKLEAGNLIYELPKGFDGVFTEHILDQDDCNLVGLILPNGEVETRLSRIFCAAKLLSFRNLSNNCAEFPTKGMTKEEAKEKLIHLWQIRTENFVENEQLLKGYAIGIESLDEYTLEHILSEVNQMFSD